MCTVMNMKHVKRKTITQASVYGILIAASTLAMLRWQQEQSRKSQNETKPSAQQVKETRPPSPTKTFLKQAMLAQRDEIESCYDDYLAREPEKQSGSVAVLWEIQDDGSVRNAEVTQTELRDQLLQECVLKKIGQMKFDPQRVEAPTRYSYRFHFKAKAPGSIHFE